MTSARLDIWLDVACLFKTRSEAQRACTLGKISVNGAVSKANRQLKVGDAVIVQRPLGRKQTLVVKGLAITHVSKADARLLYEDLTPPPTAEEIEMRRMERLFRATMTPPGRPDRRQRRQLRQLKQGGIDDR